MTISGRKKRQSTTFETTETRLSLPKKMSMTGAVNRVTVKVKTTASSSADMIFPAKGSSTETESLFFSISLRGEATEIMAAAAVNERTKDAEQTTYGSAKQIEVTAIPQEISGSLFRPMTGPKRLIAAMKAER